MSIPAPAPLHKSDEVDANTREDRFQQIAAELGYSFEGEIGIGGHYVSAVRHADAFYVSGQIPRVENTVVVTGRVGAETTLGQARVGARICTMRALAILRQSLGSLDQVRHMLRITVYVQSAPEFTAQSEVADAASDILHSIFGAAGGHTRTSVGVFQLPKNAAVEIDMIVAVCEINADALSPQLARSSAREAAR